MEGFYQVVALCVPADMCLSHLFLCMGLHKQVCVEAFKQLEQIQLVVTVKTISCERTQFMLRHQPVSYSATGCDEDACTRCPSLALLSLYIGIPFDNVHCKKLQCLTHSQANKGPKDHLHAHTHTHSLSPGFIEGLKML